MKTAVITGGNSGIGKAAAVQLAQKGYRVIIHGRDVEKTKQAAEDIKKRSGSQHIDFVTADMSLIKGMKAFADAVKEKTDTIHALILSTGVILTKHIITEDDLEKGFAVQYLARFASVQLLLPELTKGNAKIVHVGASVLPSATIFFDDIALTKNFTMFRAMAQEMFANHLFIQEFSKRYPQNNMVMNMGEVGVAKTEITRNLNFFLRLGVAIIGKTPEKTAKHFVALVSDDAITFSGYFIKSNGKIQNRTKIIHDSAVAERLWNKSMELISTVNNN